MFGWFKKKKNEDPGYTAKNLAAEVIEESKKRYPNEDFIYDEKMNTVRSVSGNGARTFLGNIFNGVKDMSAKDRHAYIEDFFDTVTQTSGELTLETLELNLMTRVRTASEIDLRNLTLHSTGSDKTFFTVNVGKLLFDLTVDYGNALSTPTRDALTAVAGGDQIALNLALQNLKRISDGSPWENTESHIWASKYQDDYDAARLICLYPEYQLPDGVKNPIVYMPAHNVCLIADSDDRETLKLLIEKGNELAGNGRKLSIAFWQNKTSGWEHVVLDKTHPSHALVQHQMRLELATFYSEQKEHLEEIFLNENLDVFVASVLLYQDETDGSDFSCSVLSLEVDTLLPKTDKVAFVDPNRPEKEQFLGMLLWDEFAALIGSDKLKLYKSLDPVRYDFTDGLDENDFSKIRQHFS